MTLDLKMSRKSFLAAGAAAIGALALAGKARAADPPPAGSPAAGKPPVGPPPPSAVHFPVLKQSEWDHKKFDELIKTKKPHKLIYEAVEPKTILPGLSSLYVHMQNSLNAGEVSFGYGKGNMSVSAVLLGPAVALALNDAMWAKYNLGAVIDAKGADGKPETKNVFYKAETNLSFDGEPGAPGNVYQDWSAEACIKRGASFWVCHNALVAVGMMIAMHAGADPSAVVAEFKQNLLPGFMLVPAGVGALYAAMEAGWKVLPLI